MALSLQVQLKIRKPVAEVFDAVVDPKKLTGYFISASSGALVAGQTVMWKFVEVADDFPVIVGEVVKNERITFDWPAADQGRAPKNTHVEMAFKPIDAANTMVQITESGWAESPAGIKSSQGNAGGWMHMMACLKGYLEYGINLRAGGAF